MRRTRYFLLALGLLLSSWSTPVLAQGGISGVVVDRRTSRPIAEAVLRVISVSGEQVTDAQGQFAFLTLDPGRLVLETQHLGFVTRTDTVWLAAGEHKRLDIRLAEAVIELQPLTVETRSRRLDEAGFFGRKARGIGVFITQDEIQAQQTRHIGDLLSRVPGMRRALMSDGGSRMDARGGKLLVSRCDLQYFVDGVRFDVDAGGIDAIPIHVIEGVEVYRGASEVPTQFDVGRAMCGAVLIWTTNG